MEAAADDLHEGAALLLERLEVVLPVVRAGRSPESDVNPKEDINSIGSILNPSL